MKKNIVIIFTVIAISVATVKTGYAFYGKQISNNQTSETQVTNSGGDSQQGIIQTDFSESVKTSDRTAQDWDQTTQDWDQTTQDWDQTAQVWDQTSEDADQTDNSLNGGNCCGSGPVNMIDDNGNLKDIDTFTKELDEAVLNGDITEDDKEYYLFMYGKCADAFGVSASDSDNTSDADSYNAQDGAAAGNDGFNPPSCH